MFIQQGTLGFASHKGTGPQISEQAVNFSKPVHNAITLLSGFDVQFVDDDHHLHLLEIDLRNRNLSSQAVEVTGSLGLRDASNRWDDRYAGSLRYTVIGTEGMEQALGGTLSFPPSEGSGPRTLNENIRFSSPVIDPVACLSGFVARFSTSDRHLLQIESDIDFQLPNQNELQVSGTYGLRDSSGHWDDEYDGVLRYAAIGPIRNKDGVSQIKTGRVEFNPQSGQGPREQTISISFARPIGNCAAVLTGFLIGYDKNDHHVHRLIIEVEARKMSETDVEVVCRLGLRDNSGHWDDAYRGSIRFAVLGE